MSDIRLYRVVRDLEGKHCGNKYLGNLVTCGECKKTFNAEGKLICKHLSGMVGLNVVVKDDDFCSYGEREGE